MVQLISQLSHTSQRMLSSVFQKEATGGSGVVGVCGLLKLKQPLVAIEDAGPGTDVVSEEL